MNIIRKHSFAKAVVVAGMSLSLMFSGSLFLNSGSAHAAVASSSSASASSAIISTGQQFMGVPYKYGAESGNTRSFDCSSFVQHVYKLNGITLPRSSRQQSEVGTYVPRDQLKPGDLVFFYSPIHHVAIYIGDGKILHTYGTPGVTISDLNSGSWDSHYNMARRVLPAGEQAVAEPAKPAEPVKTVEPAEPEAGQPEYDSGWGSDGWNWRDLFDFE